MELVTREPTRDRPWVDTGVFVRAKQWDTGRWESVDIGCLTDESFERWVRERSSESNSFAPDLCSVLWKCLIERG